MMMMLKMEEESLSEKLESGKPLAEWNGHLVDNNDDFEADQANQVFLISTIHS